MQAASLKESVKILPCQDPEPIPEVIKIKNDLDSAPES